MERNETVTCSLNSNNKISQENSRGNRIRILICPTTGGTMELYIPIKETVQGLKWAISRQLKIPQDRIHLLYRERLLKSGLLKDNHICDNSRITLLPNMESGMSKGKDLGVMQALANLSDSQVNDFLSGRAPLLLALRLGDHMMFIQLQLSTSQCSNRRHRPAPVTVPSPGQFSVQDHQEIPSPTLTPRSPISETSHLSQKMQNVRNISDNLQVNRPSPSKLRIPSANSPVSVSSTSPAGTTSEGTSPATSPSGAVIESMHHIGNGIYSGTFSGTLDPSLQDSSGKPRRDISTILHILNDLLGAHPEYRQQKYFFNHQQNIQKDAFNQSYHDNQKTGDISSSNIESNDSDLREKVRHLQMMMEEKKLRRKARRDMRAPYQWERKQTGYSSIGEYKDEECNTEEETCDNEECMEVADSVNETPSSYNGSNQNLEHETVAV